MTPLQCTNARRLLGISQAALAKKLKMPQVVISEFELTGHMAQPRQSGRDRLVELRAWFEQAGIEFGSDNEGAGGVRLQKVQA